MAYGSKPSRHYSGSVLQQKRARRNKLTKSSHPSEITKLTTAAHAANVFGVYSDDFDMAEDCYPEKESSLTEYMVDSEPYQLELPLITQEEMELDMRQTINRYNASLEKMGEYALKWHWLMEDVERFTQVEKTFKDLQVFRRLCGGGDPNLEDLDH